MEVEKEDEEQKTANRGLDAARGRQDAFDLQNVYAGMDTPDISMSGYDPSQAQIGQLGPAQQAQLAELGPSQGYDAQGYTAQGYDPRTTSIGGLARGAATGLTNTMANLQVSTAAADMQAQRSRPVISSVSRFSCTSWYGSRRCHSISRQRLQNQKLEWQHL